MNPKRARETELRFQTSVHDAVMNVLGTTPEKAALCEAMLEIDRVYGDTPPYMVAIDALSGGDKDLYEAAMADVNRITTLKNAAKKKE